MPRRGILITFEGSEGAGKSTQMERLVTRLLSAGRRVQVLREPGGTELGEDLRRMLKYANYGDILFDETELLLFAASRAQLVREVILPALSDGKVVICDRFTDSSVAYQGYGRGGSLDFIRRLNKFAAGGVTPAMTVLLDLPAEEGMVRARRRKTTGKREDRMETMESDFYERVCEGYRTLAAADPERFFVVDARDTAGAISEEIWREFLRRKI